MLAAVHAEGRLELVLLADADLPLSTGEINHGEEASASGLVDELLDVGQGFHGVLRDGSAPFQPVSSCISCFKPIVK